VSIKGQSTHQSLPKHLHQDTDHAHTVAMDRQAARRSGGGAKKSVQATSHLKAMLQDQEDGASVPGNETT